MRWQFLFLFIQFISFASARELNLEESRLVSSISNNLPSSLLEKVTHLSFRVSKLNSSKINFCNKVSSKTIFAKFNPFIKTISLDTHLVNSYFRCKKKLQETLEKTIIHEYLHAYDTLDRKTRRKKLAHSKKYKVKVEPKRITENSTFKIMAMTQGRTLEDFTGDRLYSPYELKDIDEFAATNFEGFIFDNEYKCRRPSIYKFFSEHFSIKPFDDFQCQSTNLIYAQKNIQHRFRLDPDYIYQVHYLHASEGSDFIGGFGHSMVRVVLCESRYNIGENCLTDNAEDLILSFRGNVASLKIDPLAGMSGDYPSILFAFTFSEIINEYTKKELRSLISYPLLFNRKQIGSFTNRALEIFWGYSGRYRFLSNNCSSETYKLITGVDSIFTHSFKSITPNGILEDLFKIGLIDPSFKELKTAKRKNLYYKDHFQNIKLALNQLGKTKIDKPGFIDIAKNDPLYFSRFLPMVDTSNTKTAQLDLAALYILNRHVRFIYYQNLQRDYQEKLVKFIEKHPEIKPEVQKALVLFNPDIDKNGYGIPTESEVSKIKWEMAQSNDESLAIINQFQTKINYEKELTIVNKLINTLDRIMEIKRNI